MSALLHSAEPAEPAHRGEVGWLGQHPEAEALKHLFTELGWQAIHALGPSTPVQDKVCRQVEAADAAMLEMWFDRILDVTTLGAVFGAH